MLITRWIFWGELDLILFLYTNINILSLSSSFLFFFTWVSISKGLLQLWIMIMRHSILMEALSSLQISSFSWCIFDFQPWELGISRQGVWSSIAVALSIFYYWWILAIFAWWMNHCPMMKSQTCCINIQVLSTFTWSIFIIQLFTHYSSLGLRIELPILFSISREIHF